MTFANIALLGGIGLVALPIVLHLIMRRKPRLLEFPAMRFIQKQHDTNRRRLRLRHWLLLALRAGAIGLLAFALAQPSVKFGGGLGSQEAPVAAALIFDAAPRMQYRHENRTRLEVAEELGLWVLDQLPSGSQIAVLDTRSGVGTLHDDPGIVRQRIGRLETVANSQPLTEVLDRAARLLAQSPLPQREIYVFTDLSRAAWPADPAAALQEQIAETPGMAIQLIDVGVRQPTNYALGRMQLSGQVLSNRGSLQIETTLSRIETAPEDETTDRTVEVHLLDQDRNPQKRSQQNITLRPGESRQVDFRIESLDVGTHEGFIRVVGQDGLAEDDVRFLTVEVKPPWRILVAAPKPSQDYALFLTEALAPELYRKQGQARFDCQVVDLQGLAQYDLTDISAVCLVDPKPMEPAVWQKLADYVAEGHGLGVFLGRNARPVDSFNTPLAQKLLAGKLIRQARTPDGDVCLAPQSFQHPVLAEFRPYAGAIPWQDFPVFRYWQLEDPAGTIVRLSDGRPVVLERAHGKGRVLTMTTPVSDRPNRQAWNLLPVGDAWPFLGLMHQMTGYLVGSGQQQLNYHAGQAAVLPLDPTNRQRTYLLTTPDELNFPLAADLKQHQLVVSSTEKAGNYRIQAPGSADRGFSVNLTPEQTELRRIGEDELTELFGPFDYRLARTRTEIERGLSEARVGRELFPALILLVALTLAAEYIVANKFYKQ